MKKIMIALAALIMISGAVFAEDSGVSKEKLDKLASLTAKEAEKTGLANVDSYTSSLYDAARDAVSNGNELNTLYSDAKSSMGASKMSIISKATALWTKIKDNAEAAKSSTGLAAKAAEEIKSIKNPAQKAKIAQLLKDNSSIASLLGEETTSQVKGVGDLLGMLKKK